MLLFFVTTKLLQKNKLKGFGYGFVKMSVINRGDTINALFDRNEVAKITCVETNNPGVPVRSF